MNDETLALPAPEQPKLLPAPRKPESADHDRGDRRRRRRVLLIAAAVLLVLLLVGWFLHHRQSSQAEEAAARTRDRLPSVSTITVATSPPLADLRLPGTITPLTEASLFARASGYLKARHVDIGDTVKRGQVLAEIDAPDLDQQLAGARQQLDQARSGVNDAKARVDLARVTYQRLVTLVKDEAVAQQQVDQSKQDLDTANASVASSNANVGAARANVERLVALQGFEKLRAPFDGIVTARSVDVGALVNAAGASSGQSGASGSGATAGGAAGGGASATGGDAQGGGQATELFRVAQVDRVRVFVTVPQENAAALDAGHDAAVFVQGYDRPFDGQVTRTARALDPTARTLLVEVQVANPKRTLVPGMYAQVRFRSPRQGTPLLVPGEAVIARADGLKVAVVEELSPDDRARLPPRPPHDEKKTASGKDSKDGDAGKKAKKSSGTVDSGGNESRKGRKEDDKADPAKSDDADDDDPQHARRIHLQQVEVGRDYGTEVEIVRGLAAGATIVGNPGDDVVEGALVMPHARKPPPGPGAGAKQDAAKRDQAKQDDSGATDGRKPPAGEGRLAPDGPPQGNQSPSMEAPTKGRK